MSALHHIGGPRDASRTADVVFVHGLGGHPRGTWTPDEPENALSWPELLAEHRLELTVWSLEYDAPRSDWEGTGKPLFDRADEVLDRLATDDIGGRPLAFVTHSMGGLLVKQLLRTAWEIAPAYRSIA